MRMIRNTVRKIRIVLWKQAKRRLKELHTEIAARERKARETTASIRVDMTMAKTRSLEEKARHHEDMARNFKKSVAFYGFILSKTRSSVLKA